MATWSASVARAPDVRDYCRGPICLEITGPPEARTVSADFFGFLEAMESEILSEIMPIRLQAKFIRYSRLRVLVDGGTVGTAQIGKYLRKTPLSQGATGWAGSPGTSRCRPLRPAFSDSPARDALWVNCGRRPTDRLTSRRLAPVSFHRLRKRARRIRCRKIHDLPDEICGR